MSHRLMGIATLVTLAGCATALFGPTALGQPLSDWTQVQPRPALKLELQFPGSKTWTGSASCTGTGSSSMKDPNYSGTETHTWTIIPWLIYTDGTHTYYAETWTATGSGSNSTNSWTVNATGKDINGQPTPGYLWFRLSSGLLNISRFSTQQVDHTGSSGGLSADVGEPAFPGPLVGPASNQSFGTIVADPTVLDSVKSPANGVTLKTVGSSLSNEPGDATTSWTCTWDFEYAPHLQPLPRKPLVKPPQKPELPKS
jgi:hypothetical protein